MVVEYHPLPDLFNLSSVHQGDPIAQAHRLSLIVRDQDHRGSRFPLDAPDLAAHLPTEPRVQVGQRLIKQQDVGPAQPSAGRRYSLLLTAGKFCRATPQQIGIRKMAAISRILLSILDLLSLRTRKGHAMFS